MNMFIIAIMGLFCFHLGAFDLTTPRGGPVQGYALFEKIATASPKNLDLILNSYSNESLATITNGHGQTPIQAVYYKQYESLAKPRDLSSSQLLRFMNLYRIAAELNFRFTPIVPHETIEWVLEKRKAIFLAPSVDDYEQSVVLAEQLFQAAVAFNGEELGEDQREVHIRRNLEILSNVIYIRCDRMAVVDALISVHAQGILSDEQLIFFIEKFPNLFPVEFLPSQKDVLAIVAKLQQHAKKCGLNFNDLLLAFFCYVDEIKLHQPQANAVKLNGAQIKAELREVSVAEVIYSLDYLQSREISFERMVDFARVSSLREHNDIRQYVEFSERLVKFVRASILSADDKQATYRHWRKIYRTLHEMNDLNGAFCVALGLNHARRKCSELKNRKAASLAVRKEKKYHTYFQVLEERIQARKKDGRQVIPSILLAKKYLGHAQNIENLIHGEALNHSLLHNLVLQELAFCRDDERSPTIIDKPMAGVAHLLLHLPKARSEEFPEATALLLPSFAKGSLIQRFSQRFSKPDRKI